MKTQNFISYIKEIRKEALELGYSKSTIDGYWYIWKQFILWKNVNTFEYEEKEYSKFLLEHYNFDVNTYTNKSKSHHQQFMRSKRILDNFDIYKQNMNRKVLPKSIFKYYPEEWKKELNLFLSYCQNVRQNAINSVKLKKYYIEKIYAYFYQCGVNNLNELNKKCIVSFINDSVDKGNRSKGRYFYILREFLDFLLMEDIIHENLSSFIPKIKRCKRKKIPTYFSCEEIEKILEEIPRVRKVEIRNYAIILIAARLGLRISDILNIKTKDIDWINNKITIIQQKNYNLNILPLTKEVGWAIIDYIKNARPKTDSEYLFIKMKYPFKKMNQFNKFNKYFEKTDIEAAEENKKGIHNLRHSLATNMLENEIPLDIIASTLGDSIETTSNTYLRVAHKQLKECILEVNE